MHEKRIKSRICYSLSIHFWCIYVTKEVPGTLWEFIYVLQKFERKVTVWRKTTKDLPIGKLS